MREIKFRVWDLAVGAMIVPSPTDGAFHIDQNGVVKIPGTNKPLNHCVLEQHTGLKDKNGLTEIYEGDILDEEGHIRGNIHESPGVYQTIASPIVARLGDESWENAKQGFVREGQVIAEQSDLPQILRELGGGRQAGGV